jgi:hypothetical protein
MSTLRDELEAWVTELDDFTIKRLTEHLVIDDNYAQVRLVVKQLLGIVEDDVNNTATSELSGSGIAEYINRVEEW